MTIPYEPKDPKEFPGMLHDEGAFHYKRSMRWYGAARPKGTRLHVKTLVGRFAVIELSLSTIAPWMTDRLKERRTVASLHADWKAEKYPYAPGLLGAKNTGRGGWKTVILK